MTKDDVIASMAIVAINKDDAVYLSLPSTRAVMDEYAKQRVMAYGKWYRDHPKVFIPSESRQDYWYASADGIPVKYYSLEDLYDLFDSEQQQNNK